MEATQSAILLVENSLTLAEQVNKFSPLLTLASVILGLISFGIYLGSLKTKFNLIESQVTTILGCVESLNECVNEIQTSLKAKIKGLQFDKETMAIYGKANSPIVLKDEFRPFIGESGLLSQIEDKKEKLIKWLEKRKPNTGLDAQDLILDLVVSDEIEKYLDTREFKKLLYEDGKTLKDYYIILAIYLFETIIPEVIDEDEEK